MQRGGEGASVLRGRRPAPGLPSVPVVSEADCCSVLFSLQHSKTAVLVKEDVKKMVQIPMLRPRAVAAKHTKLFGVSLFELREKGLVQDGVPLVVRRMVEHLHKHGEERRSRKDRTLLPFHKNLPRHCFLLTIEMHFFKSHMDHNIKTTSVNTLTSIIVRKYFIIDSYVRILIFGRGGKNNKIILIQLLNPFTINSNNYKHTCRVGPTRLTVI